MVTVRHRSALRCLPHPLAERVPPRPRSHRAARHPPSRHRRSRFAGRSPAPEAPLCLPSSPHHRAWPRPPRAVARPRHTSRHALSPVRLVSPALPRAHPRLRNLCPRRRRALLMPSTVLKRWSRTHALRPPTPLFSSACGLSASQRGTARPKVFPRAPRRTTRGASHGFVASHRHTV